MDGDIQAIVIDLDGTLLDSSKNISKQTLRTLRLASEQGLRILLATGRSLKATERYIMELGLSHPLICYNGSCVYDPLVGKDLFHTHLNERVCSELLSVEQEVNCSFHAYRRHEVHTIHSERHSEYLKQMLHVQDSSDMDITSLQTYEFTKAVFVGDFSDTEQVRRHLSETFTDSIHQVYSRPHFFEVMSSKATKGDALKLLLEHEGIEAERVMAIGDENNDLEMLRMVGHPVAMANATKQVKQAARYHTSSCDEEGVARIIERIVLA
ncbi:MAG: HAD family phosphatase [Sphaerochaetaceae bacterium]|nr:HAD family phosphatase [Sphaerochaetaceae bacterium]